MAVFDLEVHCIYIQSCSQINFVLKSSNVKDSVCFLSFQVVVAIIEATAETGMIFAVFVSFPPEIVLLFSNTLTAMDSFVTWCKHLANLSHWCSHALHILRGSKCKSLCSTKLLKQMSKLSQLIFPPIQLLASLCAVAILIVLSQGSNTDQFLTDVDYHAVLLPVTFALLGTSWIGLMHNRFNRVKGEGTATPKSSRGVEGGLLNSSTIEIDAASNTGSDVASESMKQPPVQQKNITTARWKASKYLNAHSHAHKHTE